MYRIGKYKSVSFLCDYFVYPFRSVSRKNSSDAVLPLAADRRERDWSCQNATGDREVESEKGQRKRRQRCCSFDVADFFDAKGIRSHRGFPPQRDKLKMWHHEEVMFCCVCRLSKSIEVGVYGWRRLADGGRLEGEAQEILLENNGGDWERTSERQVGCQTRGRTRARAELGPEAEPRPDREFFVWRKGV